MEKENKKISIPLIIGGLVLVIVIGAAGVSVFLSNSGNTENPGDSVTDTTDSINNSSEIVAKDEKATEEETVADSSVMYTDGTYDAVGTYTSPAGEEEIDVSLTIEDNVIVDVVVTSDPSNATTKNYQSKFKEGVAGVVVGQKIDEVAFEGNINGSSLTPQGFLNALEMIKAQAQS